MSVRADLRKADALRQERHQKYVDLATDLRERLRLTLKPGSDQNRDFYKLANDLLYGLRGDPGMGDAIDAACAALDEKDAP